MLDSIGDNLLDRLTESISVYDGEGRLEYVNEAGASFFARPKHEMLGRKPWEVVGSTTETPFQVALRAVLAGAERQSVFTFAPGLQKWFECDLYRLNDGALVVARDVTARRLAAEKLLQSEARFRMMVEYAPEAIVIFDVRASRLTVVNPAAERLFGRGREELLTCDLTALSPLKQPDGSASGPRIEGYVMDATRGATPEFEWTIRNAAGQEVPCEVRLLKLPHDGDLLVRGSLTDISARKRLQAQLAQSQQLDAVGRLAGGVAHDFNNMMTVVLGTAELMLGRLPPGDPLRGELGDIVGAAERAALVTRQLLAFGRRQRLAPLLVDLGSHVEHMNRVLQRILGEDIELDLDLARPLGLVRVDAGQLEQVILNLVVNARDAMPRGGRMSIETRNVTLEPDDPSEGLDLPPGRYVMLGVGDSGEGMTEEVRSHIFEPFFTTKELGRGTGLGLATVHGVVEQSGGHIRVETAPGAGTTFRVYLPRVDTPTGTKTDPPPSSGARHGGTETVLLVEDDPSVRQYVRRALQSGGYTVLEASNGGEALLIVEQHLESVDLLLTDVVMPRMTGPQLALRLRAVRANLRALYMSGYAEDRLSEQGRLGEGDAFVQKPVNPEDLLRCVRATLDR